MQWTTAVAALVAPTLAWGLHKGMLPLSRFIDRHMRDGKLKRALLAGGERGRDGRLR